MIFVTVGTHEQPFNRLVKYIDELKGKGVIQDEVVIQTGFCTYEPQHCEWKKLFPYQEMVEYVKKARIVITHGGPSSFIMPLQIGKTPIVVPRQKAYDEHVNDHQVEFCEAVAERNKNIIVILEIGKLDNTILEYEAHVRDLSAEVTSNNALFNQKFETLVKEMFAESIKKGK